MDSTVYNNYLMRQGEDRSANKCHIVELSQLLIWEAADAQSMKYYFRERFNWKGRQGTQKIQLLSSNEKHDVSIFQIVNGQDN